MSFLAAGYLIASLAAAAAIVALHFIIVRPPRSAVLPTARFVPQSRATTVASAPRPSDWWLMLLRVVAIVAAGAALAKPVLEPRRRATASVLLVDDSRSVSDVARVRDSVRAIYHDGDAIVVFDSSARVIGGSVEDSIRALASTNRRGNLGTGLIAAIRAGSTLRERADSVRLVIVSPVAAEELDAATDSIRALWPGGARVVLAGAGIPDTAQANPKITLDADPSDPLSVTVALVRPRAGASIARRGGETSSNAPSINVDWPLSSRPPAAIERSRVDTIGGVIAGARVVVAPFERRWIYPPDSLGGAEVIARWVDGEPAAIERPLGSACTKSVAIPVTPIGDLVIRTDFVRLVTTLAGPCERSRAFAAADPKSVAALTRGRSLAPRTAFSPRTDKQSPLTPWLLGLALLSVLAELVARRRNQSTDAIVNQPASRDARAA